jgi:hypothetical protein
MTRLYSGKNADFRSTPKSHTIDAVEQRQGLPDLDAGCEAGGTESPMTAPAAREASPAVGAPSVSEAGDQRRPNPRERRGVLLLIALVMLTLFMLLGTTYIIVSNRRKSCGASSIWAGSVTVNQARVTSSSALELLLVGQPRPNGAAGPLRKIQNSSLLADKYGDCYEQAKLLTAPASFTRGAVTPITTAGNQELSPRFFKIDTDLPTGYPASDFIADPRRLGPYPGRILTIENASEVNAVFRIVASGSNPTTGAHTFIAHQVNPGASLDIANLKTKDKVTIQGREFTGDPLDGSVDVHESYDAPEGRNWFLTWLQTDAVLGRDQTPGGDDPADGYRYVIPAFHRPDKLLAEFKANPGNVASAWLDAANPSLLRPAGKMSLDPTVPWTKFGVPANPAITGYSPDHPNFTGSNVRLINGQNYYFDPINGPWDVDNDNDGIADSIWLDVGMDDIQINAASCRPLVAMMVVDLDSRTNLNTHGTLGEARFAVSPLAVKPPAGVYYAGASLIPSGTANQNPARAGVAAGQGWGTADVNPRLVFDDTTNTIVPRVLAGSPTTGTQTTPKGVKLPDIYAEGRYGDSVDGTGALAPAPGRLTVADPSIDDAASTQPRDARIPNAYGRGGTLGSPVDPWGFMKVGLDQLGQPFFSRPQTTGSSTAPVNQAWLADQIDDPYDLSVGRTAPKPGWTFDPAVGASPSQFQDNLFIPAQLERILRMFDGDADTLSPRLASLVGSNAEIARVAATTESWDSAAVCVPLAAWKKLLELSDQRDKTKPSLVSWDLQMGLGMDVNRPFGDGIDNTPAGSPGRGIADEPGEFAAEKSTNAYGLAATTYADQALTNGRDVDDVNPDGDADANDQLLARQLFARHLYVLARTLAPSIPAKDAAQWAVNTVDFRDSDSIITRFEYDAEFDPNAPTPAWDVKNPSAPSDPPPVVWGCERPEMLITEAVAWRNIEESGTSVATYKWSDTPTGGLVVELYNPWTALTNLTVTGTSGELVRGSPVPAEFATDPDDRYGATSTINLATLNAADEPVFQIVAVIDSGSTTTNKLASDPSWPRFPTDQDDIERIIHLGDPGTAPKRAALQRGRNEGGKNRCFIPRSGTSAAALTLQPGQFAIVGGPQASGSTTLRHTIEKANPDASNGLDFNLTNFSDSAQRQPLSMTAGLTETVTANGRTAADRETARAFPADRAKGPVGSLVCTVDPDDPNSMLRMPVGPSGSTDLNFVVDAKYRILLRRLANPLDKFDETKNPYICIDSLVVHDQGVIKDNKTDPTKQAASTTLTVESAERGGSQTLASKINNLWKTADGDTNQSAGNYSGYAYCGRRNPASTLKASLGFLPENLRIPEPDDAELPAFPWLPWLNRDFATVHELLLVPKSSPAALLRDHTHQAPFDHLFFESGTDTERNAKFGLLEFLRAPSRFMDAEQRLAPAAAIAVSDALASAFNGRPLYLPPHNYLSHFREPGRVNLNTLSSSRVWEAMLGGRPTTPYEDEVAFDNAGNSKAFVPSEDWRLNTNPNAATLPGSGNWVLDAGEDTSPGNQALDRNDDTNNDGRQTYGKQRSLAASRRGWDLAGLDDPDPSDAAIAGQFDRVLNRAGVPGDDSKPEFLNPWFSMPFQAGWKAAGPEYDRQQSLLLRQNESGTHKPFLFTTDVAVTGTNGVARSGFPASDPLRNPFFRYQTLSRLSNVATPRSNVFAVWMTIGFFTLENGRLGAEYGLDNGEAVRHKAFMLIDRSLPVGYRPGETFNARETVLIDHMTN